MNVRAAQSREGAPSVPDVVFDVREADLSDDVRPFAVNIHEQIRDILARHAVGSIAAFQEKLLGVERRQRLAAAKDVVQLIALTDKLKFVFDQAKPLEGAFEDRHRLTAIVDTVRAAVDDEETLLQAGDELQLRPSLIVANLYLVRDTARDVEALCSTPGFDSLRMEKLAPCVRALGAFHQEEDAELLCDTGGATDDNRMWLRAVYAAALPNEFADEREDILAQMRAGVPRDSEDVLGHLARLAGIELDAGLDAAATLARIATLRKDAARDVRYEGGTVARLYARLGDEETVRREVRHLAVDCDNERDVVWGDLGAYYARKGDIANVERLYTKIHEKWNALDLATDVLLPIWIARGDWEQVKDVPSLECMQSLCKKRPDLVAAYYPHIPVGDRTPRIDALYARSLAARGDDEQFLLYKKAFLQKVDDVIARPFVPGTDDWEATGEEEEAPADESFAEYLVTAHQHGESTEELLTLLDNYLRSTCRNENGEVVVAECNDRSADVIEILLDAGASDIAMRIVDRMYDIQGTPRHRFPGAWRDANPLRQRVKVLVRQLDDAIARVQASEKIRQKLEE